MRGTTNRVTRWLGIAAGLIGLCGAGCGFSPKVDSGALVCAQDGRCPDELACSPSNFCCKADDFGNDCFPARGPAPAKVTARPLVGPPASLIEFERGCTHGVPTGGRDRWCGFSRPAAAAGARELWVLNVSVAGRSPTPIPCDGSDARCLRLTTTLFEPAADKPMNGFAGPAFQGDLLLFYAEAAHNEAGGEAFRGGAFAWFPGFPTARRLTTAAGRRCFAPPRGSSPSTFCFDTAPDGTLEVRAGAAGMAEPLPVVLKPGTEDYALQINRGGERLVYTVMVPGQPKALYMARITEVGDVSRRIALAPKVTQWNVSWDGAYVYYVRDEGLPSGALVAVDTATGTQSTELGAGAKAQFFSLLDDGRGGDGGVVAYDNVAGTIGNGRLYLDRSAPGKVVALGRIGDGVDLSPNRRYSRVRATVEAGPPVRSDAKVFDNVGGSACVLQASPITERIRPAFSATSRLTFWTESVAGQRFESGWVGLSDGCGGKRRFANEVLSLDGLPGDAILYKEWLAAESESQLSWERLSPENGQTAHEQRGFFRGVVRVSVVEPDRKQAVFSGTGSGGGLFIVDLP